MSKGLVTNEEIYLVTNKYNSLLNEMNEVYRCIRTLYVDDNLIEKPRIHIQKTMLVWRDLKLPLSSSARLFEGHILNQISSIGDGITDKTEDRIMLSRQIGKRLKRRYKGVTNFTQSQTSQIKLQDLISNPIVGMKLEKGKKNIKKA